MINPDVITHLEKYFKLSRTHFAEGDYPLAAFFAITTIEETAKILLVSAKSPNKTEKRELLKQARNHREKYFVALINLIDQSSQYESIPYEWKQEIESWWDTDKIMKIRNDCLYLRYGRNNQVTIPTEVIGFKLAALLVYVSGIALVTLDDYITGFPAGWKQSILEIANNFRQRYLSV